jgi:hypothetical protein
VAVAAGSADVRLLVGALKWASLAAAYLGPEGPRRMFEMYDAIWPLAGAVKQVLTAAIEQPVSGGSPDVAVSTDGAALLLLGLHGLVYGGGAVPGGMWGG